MQQMMNGISDLFGAIQFLSPDLRAEASSCDVSAKFPLLGLTQLKGAGLLMATVPTKFGGQGLYGKAGAQPIFHLLHRLGENNLALGRIFEAHVNALELIRRYGSEEQIEAAAKGAQAGDLFALWVTDSPEKPSSVDSDFLLSGKKCFCSAAGVANRALITAKGEFGTQMLLIELKSQSRVIDRGVKLAGMRGATTGSIDLTGLQVTGNALIGQPGDYLREPAFSTGAWRSSAVALGGLSSLIEITRSELCSRGRGDQAFQRMRFGQMTIAYETGRLWLENAAVRSEAAGEPGDDAVAYVNLARTAVETSCLDAIRLVQRSLGLSAFIQGKNVERIARDLGTYLRQPAPDEALEEAAGYFLRNGITAP